MLPLFNIWIHWLSTSYTNYQGQYYTYNVVTLTFIFMYVPGIICSKSLNAISFQNLKLVFSTHAWEYWSCNGLRNRYCPGANTRIALQNPYGTPNETSSDSVTISRTMTQLGRNQKNGNRDDTLCLLASMTYIHQLFQYLVLFISCTLSSLYFSKKYIINR